MSLPPCRSACSTLQGRRDSNQDAVLDVRFPDGRHLVALADGMGGHRGGEVASATALEVLRRELQAGGSLREAVARANAVVHERAAAEPAYRGMGTTLVALLRSGAAYEIANVGDSRAYRMDRCGIQQVTRDHSFAAEALRAGALSPEEVERSPWRNALTRSLGTQAEVEVDVFGPFEVLGPPHAVVLCSDGFYRAVQDSSIREHLLGDGSVDAAVIALARMALINGSDDNISLAVVEIGPLLRSSSTTARTVREHPEEDTIPVLRWPAAAPAPPPPGQPTPASAPAAAVRARTPRWQRKLQGALTSTDLLFVLCLCSLALWLVLTLAGS